MTENKRTAEQTAALQKKICELKKEKNAVILAHYYVSPEIQEVADFLGDSLGLSRLAAQTDADTIVFAGVHFMAETAAIISPGKKVLAPAPDAGCSLADSVEAADLALWKRKHPDGIIISYVNTTAAVKAQTDICCTSANAIDVVKSVPDGVPILFGPDRNLGAYLKEMTGKNMELWSGICCVHQMITSETVLKSLDEYPDAEILIHPESRCSNDGRLISHPRVFFYSTAGMIRHATASEKKQFIIATEIDTIYELKKRNPQKNFIPLSAGLVCRQMKKVTLENVLESLETGAGEVRLDPKIAERALIPIRRMLEIK